MAIRSWKKLVCWVIFFFWSRYCVWWRETTQHSVPVSSGQMQKRKEMKFTCVYCSNELIESKWMVLAKSPFFFFVRLISKFPFTAEVPHFISQSRNGGSTYLWWVTQFSPIHSLNASYEIDEMWIREEERVEKIYLIFNNRTRRQIMR